jgi:hypothetical protein
MSTYDAPNQQVVRPDGSAPWDEGDGGTGGETPQPVKRGPGRPPKQPEPEQEPEPEQQ